MCIFLQPNQGEASHLVCRVQNPLKLLYSIMILNTISLPYKAGPISQSNENKKERRIFFLHLQKLCMELRCGTKSATAAENQNWKQKKQVETPAMGRKRKVFHYHALAIPVLQTPGSMPHLNHSNSAPPTFPGHKNLLCLCIGMKRVVKDPKL